MFLHQQQHVLIMFTVLTQYGKVWNKDEQRQDSMDKYLLLDHCSYTEVKCVRLCFTLILAQASCVDSVPLSSFTSMEPRYCGKDTDICLVNTHREDRSMSGSGYSYIENSITILTSSLRLSAASVCMNSCSRAA